MAPARNLMLLSLVPLAALALGLTAGCAEVSGGAVEARWDLRDANGVRIGCAGTRVSQVRFALSPLGGGGDPCEAHPGCRFACDLGGGSTQFVIPEADYSMSLQGLDGEGKPLGFEQGVVVPAPVTRRVVTGQVTDLNVNLIIVEERAR